MRRIIPWLICALLVALTFWLLCRRGPVIPPSVAVKPDTTWLTDTSYVVEFRPDPEASKELTKLRDELDGYRSAFERITGYLAEMEQENRYLADSLARVTLDSLRGIVRVERGPAGISVVSYQRGTVETWRKTVWRQRWTLLAGKDKPKVEMSRLPVDFGLVFGGSLLTPPNTWQPSFAAFAGLTVTRQYWTAEVGPYFDGKLKLRGNLTYNWR